MEEVRAFVADWMPRRAKKHLKEGHPHNLANMAGGVIGARVYNSGDIANIVTATITTLTFDSERYDTDTIHSTSSNTSRLTATTAGKYLIWGSATWAFTPVNGAIYLWLNGTTYIARHQPAVDYRTMNVSTVWDMAAGDYVELRVEQNSGGNVSISAISAYSPEFGMMRIGAAGSAGGGASGTDHGGLTGLSDDDHTLYLLAAGSREGSTGSAQSFGATGIKADVIAESTAAAGVTVDGSLVKDGILTLSSTGAGSIYGSSAASQDLNLYGTSGSPAGIVNVISTLRVSNNAIQDSTASTRIDFNQGTPGDVRLRGGANGIQLDTFTSIGANPSNLIGLQIGVTITGLTGNLYGLSVTPALSTAAASQAMTGGGFFPTLTVGHASATVYGLYSEPTLVKTGSGAVSSATAALIAMNLGSSMVVTTAIGVDVTFSGHFAGSGTITAFSPARANTALNRAGACTWATG